MSQTTSKIERRLIDPIYRTKTDVEAIYVQEKQYNTDPDCKTCSVHVRGCATSHHFRLLWGSQSRPNRCLAEHRGSILLWASFYRNGGPFTNVIQIKSSADIIVHEILCHNPCSCTTHKNNEEPTRKGCRVLRLMHYKIIFNDKWIHWVVKQAPRSSSDKEIEHSGQFCVHKRTSLTSSIAVAGPLANIAKHKGNGDFIQYLIVSL